MNIPHQLARIIRQSRSLSEMLDSTVALVAREMGTDVCSIYLLDPADHRLRLAATHGLDRAGVGKVVLALGEGITGTVVSEMRAIAVEDASSHPGYQYFPETREERYHAYLGVPLAMRNRPVGAIVVQSKDQRNFTTAENQTLHTISAQLVGVVENARLIQALDQPDRGAVYLEEVRAWNQRAEGDLDLTRGELVLEGNPASPGLALGRAVFRGTYDLRHVAHENDRTEHSAEEEIERVKRAIANTRQDILRTQKAASDATDEEHALIFTSHLLLVNDPTVLARLEEAIRGGLRAPSAVERVFHEIEEQLAGVTDVYLQERVEDIRDLRSRLLWQLLERTQPDEQLRNKIVVVQGIPPSLVVEMKVQGALGLITERGGLSSHGALLARSMGIPAVTGIRGLVHRIRSADEVLIDGSRGHVILRPSSRTRSQYLERAAEIASARIELIRNRKKPAKSKDGVEVTLLANIGVSSEIKQAQHFGAEGIGLYRTEFPFLLREDFPTREEQVRIYRRACLAFPEGTVLFRVLDLGGDKFHPRIVRPDESNPALGYRSLRMILDQPRLLQEQVQAFIIASEGRPVQILLPMVSSLDELTRARALVDQARSAMESELGPIELQLGAMIENPAAVEIATELAEEADFFSIGSNDLIQFVLAVDRENARVARYADPFHPAVLRMIYRSIQGVKAREKPIGFCGQIATMPEIAIVLAAMGVDSLSLTPNSIPEVKEAIRQSEILNLRAELPDILALGHGEQIRKRLATFVDKG